MPHPPRRGPLKFIYKIRVSAVSMGGATAGCEGDNVPPLLRPRGYRGYSEDDVQFSV